MSCRPRRSKGKRGARSLVALVLVARMLAALMTIPLAFAPSLAAIRSPALTTARAPCLVNASPPPAVCGSITPIEPLLISAPALNSAFPALKSAAVVAIIAFLLLRKLLSTEVLTPLGRSLIKAGSKLEAWRRRTLLELERHHAAVVLAAAIVSTVNLKPL